MKKVAVQLLFILFAFSGFAQSALRPVAQMVNAHHNSSAGFQKVNVFAQKEAYLPLADQNPVLDKATILTLNAASLKAISNAAPQAIEFALPSTTWGDLTLDLVKVNIFSEGFQVLSDESDAPVKFTPGAYYRGIIKGNNNSLAAISIVNGEVMGFVSSESLGNLVIGKMEGINPQNKHILYADHDLKIPASVYCQTEDDDAPVEIFDNPVSASDRALGDCVKLWVEVDRDITANKGSVANATSWITGVFNQVITLYSNETLEVGVGTIYVWTAGGKNKYAGNSSSAVLTKFKQGRASSFTGNLAILCNLRSNLGGVAAGFAGLCNSNRANSMCFAGLQSSYANVPTYSWTIMVCTHELGHLFSSRHTHACVWNGNNTAIDGCAGGVEGSCSVPGYPSGGGTIMSYCHLQSVGINFNNGFGLQPGNKIRTAVTNASCLAANCTPFAGSGSSRTGDDAFASAARISLTPNPASDKVLVDLQINLNDGEKGMLRLYNAQGRLVYTTTFTNENTAFYLQTGQFTAGLYFVDVQTTAEKLTTTLVIN
ncbi:MAG: T9SS type A sorting domain-containing protein [Saprospiraceae bacterium]|nr:T9SS type A sorting domain-containing protein [Saprospiraceae bacterium]